MRTTTLGRTDLQVSRIAYGTWQLGGEWGAYDEDAAATAIRHARELGVNFFDTAFAYGSGESEGVLGRALREELTRDRDAVVLATKGGIAPGSDRPRDARRETLRSQLEQSLQTLGVEHVDLYQIHWPDDDTPAEETAGALQELVDEGKVRHVGVSNYDVAQMEAFDAVRPLESLQPPYHLFRRGIEEGVLPWCRSHDVGVLVYSPLASGLLTGRMDESTTFEESDWRSQATAFTGDAFRTNLGVVEQLSELAADKGISVSRLAIAWVLAQPGVHVAIVGARSSRTIEDSLAAADVDLDDGELAEIDRIASDGVQVVGARPEGVD